MKPDDHAIAGNFHDFEPSLDAFRREVVRGLSERPKRIAPKFLYDETGCKLFDEICRLDEYYPTRTETSILRENAAEICAALGPGCRLVEFGSGSSTKTRILLDRLSSPAAYVPVDIAREHLLRSSASLSRVYPGLSVLPVCVDYTADFSLPRMPSAPRRTVAFFPGSTIGNLEPAEAEHFLRRVAALCGQGGALLIGVDLKKDRRTLERAYNDARGVTAAFNLNLLTRINRAFGVSIRSESFRHHAFYNEAFGRIEMHLVNGAEQTVQLDGAEIAFGRGESIGTEHSYKYSVEDFEKLAARSGWTLESFWVDAGRLFSVLYLVVDRYGAWPRVNGGDPVSPAR
ncbi:MAG: L-histidine N(alpha)-methyltransferase [Verrucomicrobia bacterium]|nr:L-histidine N(alpha)-methyltransferase [Verrucomicrobiota bacterium]